MTIKFINIGTSLGTRVLGKKIRLQIEEILSDNGFAIFDFSGVDSISHSFADECFGKLLLTFDMDELKSKSTFKNANSEVKKVIAFVFRERLTELETV